MKLKSGDKVRFLNEKGEGIIIRILSISTVLVRIEQGFDIPVAADQLVVVPSVQDILDPAKTEEIKNKDDSGTVENKMEDYFLHIDAEKLANAMKEKKTSSVTRPKRSATLIDPEIEIDLHIHELIESHKGMSNAQILEVQLKHFRYELEKAISNNARKITFIHGVGVGRLKQEIHQILKTYERIRFQDASYARYGFGATEVILK